MTLVFTCIILVDARFQEDFAVLNATSNNIDIINRIRTIDYNGKFIFHVSLSFLTGHEAIDVLRAFETQALALSSPYFVIWDGRNFYAGYEFQEEAKRLATSTRKQGVSKGAVVVTNDPLKKLLCKVVKLDMLFANRMEDAKAIAERVLR